MQPHSPTPLRQLRSALTSGETSSLSLVLDAFGKTAALDHAGPALNAVLELNPQAEAIAAALDAERLAGKPRGPLHGIPVLLKDNIDTADMLHTSAGSLALGDRFAPRDAPVAQKLTEAGAIILGKTNMTEFANYMAEDMPNGYSSRGGQVKSPWGDYDPSGSSTGSAVAVAAGFAPIAIGTETMGSIISPAAEAGIVGIKPTVGLVSRSGILPISISQDTAGPMGRSVWDCAFVLDILCGPDPLDPHTLHRHPVGSYAASAGAQPADKPLLGLQLGLDNRDEAKKLSQAAPFAASLRALEDLGARIIPTTPPEYPHAQMLAVLRHEFRACMDYALRGSGWTLAQIAAYNRAHAETCLRYGQSTIDAALAPGVGMTNSEYLLARRIIHEKMILGLPGWMDAEGLDAFITPEPTYFPVAGLPSVTLPVGVEKGKPIPLVLNGRAFSEHTLLRIAAALERAIGYGEVPPLRN